MVTCEVEQEIECLYTLDCKKSSRNWKREDGVLRVSPSLVAMLFEKEEAREPVVIEGTKLTGREVADLRRLGWLNGAFEPGGPSEVRIKFGDAVAALVHARSVPIPKKKKASSSRALIQVQQPAAMKKYQPLMRAKSAAGWRNLVDTKRDSLKDLPAPRVPLRTVQRPRGEDRAARRPSPRKRRDSWNDEVLFAAGDDVLRSPSVSSVGSVSEDAFARAVRLARDETGLTKKSADDRTVLERAATRAARKAPLLEPPPATKRRRKSEAASEGPESPPKESAAEAAERWLQAKTRNIELAYNACWRPSKAQRDKIERVKTDVFRDDADDHHERLRALVLENLDLASMPRESRTNNEDLVDLVVDSSLFSYRAARAALDARGLRFDKIKTALDHLDTTSSQFPPEFLAQVRDSLAKARDGSIVDELRAYERPDEIKLPSPSRGDGNEARPVEIDDDDNAIL